MVRNLSFGWAEISIDEYKEIASRSTNIPFDVLDAICQYKKYNKCQIKFDREKWKYTLNITPETAYIIEEKNDATNKIDIKTSPDDIITTLYNDIISDPDGWLSFMSDDDKHYADNKNVLTAKLAIASKLL